MFDWAKFGIELISMGVVALAAFFAVKVEIAVLSVKVDAQKTALDDLRSSLKEVPSLKSDLRLVDQRVGAAEQDIRNLQRGEGYVLPISRSAYEASG
jgi:cell division protein FtsL